MITLCILLIICLLNFFSSLTYSISSTNNFNSLEGGGKTNWGDIWIQESPMGDYPNPKLEGITQFIKEIFHTYNIKYKTFNAVEVGAGHGVNTIHVFSRLFKTVLATEPNKILFDDLNKNIKEKNIENVTTKISDCENIKLDKKYDIVLFSSVFMFVTDKEKCLKNVNNILNKGGYLLIIEPSKFTDLPELRESDTLSIRKKRFQRHEELLDSMRAIWNTKDFKVIRFTGHHGQIFYLLQKI